MKDIMLLTDILENAVFGLDGIEIKGEFIPVFSNPNLIYNLLEVEHVDENEQ